MRPRPLPLLVNTFGREKEVSNLKTQAMGAGLNREQDLSAQAPGEGVRISLLRPGVCVLAFLPSSPVAPAGVSFLLWRVGTISSSTSSSSYCCYKNISRVLTVPS